MKNFIYPQKISRFVLNKPRNRSIARVVRLRNILSHLNDKTLLSKQTRRRTYTQGLIAITLSLSGCMGVYEGGFECPPGIGVGCKSISDVNQMVDQCSVLSTPCSEDRMTTSKIWYSPSFDVDQKEKRKARSYDLLSI